MLAFTSLKLVLQTVTCTLVFYKPQDGIPSINHPVIKYKWVILAIEAIFFIYRNPLWALWMVHNGWIYLEYLKQKGHWLCLISTTHPKEWKIHFSTSCSSRNHLLANPHFLITHKSLYFPWVEMEAHYLVFSLWTLRASWKWEYKTFSAYSYALKYF